MNNRAKTFIKVALLAVFLLILGVPFVGAQSDNAGTTLQDASKTATGYWERVWDWSINKSVDKPIINMFTGDSQTATYTVNLTKTEGANRVYVSGEICVTNGGDRSTKNLKIVDNIQGKGQGDQWATFQSALVDVSSNPVLDPGEEGCYPYLIEFPGVAGVKYRNEALITITNHSGRMGEEFGTQDRTEFTVPTAPNSEINATVNVTDSVEGDLGSFSDSGSANYSRTFTCGQTTNYPNTATIDETGQSSSANVQVNCYDLSVSKNGALDYTRTWSWTVEKTGETDSLVLEEGQAYLGFAYEVVVNGTTVDSDYAVSGAITITNNAPSVTGLNANLAAVTDLYAGSLNLSVDCGGSMVVPAGQKLVCTYSGDVDGAGTNLATATLQNYADGAASGTTDFSGSYDVVKGDPTTVIDECVTVTDSIVGDLGNFCAAVSDTTYSQPFNYTADISAYDECGNYQVENIATVTASDTNTTTSDNHVVDINIPCVGGCSLTQGYWKTHSANGPAPYDDTWAIFDLNPDFGQYETFFLSGQNYYAVLWQPPAGNAYYNLAHQYIAAVLNGYNGADTGAVDATIAAAEDLLNTYTPTQVAEWKGGKGARKDFISLAGTLASYNEGTLSVPHCDEDSTSDNSE